MGKTKQNKHLISTRWQNQLFKGKLRYATSSILVLFVSLYCIPHPPLKEGIFLNFTFRRRQLIIFSVSRRDSWRLLYNTSLTYYGFNNKNISWRWQLTLHLLSRSSCQRGHTTVLGQLLFHQPRTGLTVLFILNTFITTFQSPRHFDEKTRRILTVCYQFPLNLNFPTDIFVSKVCTDGVKCKFLVMYVFYLNILIDFN